MIYEPRWTTINSPEEQKKIFSKVGPMFNQKENKKHNPYAVWQSREYRLFSVGWLALVMAGQIEAIAVGINVYVRTADPLALAASVVAGLTARHQAG